MSASATGLLRDEHEQLLKKYEALQTRADELSPEEARERDVILSRLMVVKAKLDRQARESLEEIVRSIRVADPATAGRFFTAAAPVTLGAAVVGAAGFKALQPTFPTEGPYRQVFEPSGQKPITTLIMAAVQLPVPLPAVVGAAPPPVVAQALRVAQLLREVPTDDNPVQYWQFKGKPTPGAGVVPTGTLKPAVTIDRELKAGPLVTIAETLLVDDSQLEDSPGLQAVLDSELAYDLADKLDGEILQGNATGGRWVGLLAGATGPVARGRRRREPARRDQRRRRRPGRRERARARRIGSFAFGAKIDTKGGLRVDVSNSVGDSFLRNQSALRVELRCFLAITRPATFAKITALPG